MVGRCKLPLLDDGNHGDGNANDGTYGNIYTPTTAASTRRGPPEDPNPERGSYNVRLDASGKDNLGGTFERIKKGSFQVFEGFNREQKDPDADKDGMPTRYEELHSCLNPDVADADKDGDEDGVTNGEEYKVGTNPCNPDTDGGGESDRSELGRGANVFDPRDDALPRPVDVEVVNWVLDHLPRPDIRPNSNLIRYPVNPAYEKIRCCAATNPNGPFVEVSTFSAKDFKGLYRDEGLTNGTTYYYKVQGVDMNGNTSAPSHIFRGRPQADSIPPIGHVLINLHRSIAIGTLVRLHLFIDPEGVGSGASHDLVAPQQVGQGYEVLISNRADFSDAKWQPYQETIDWQVEPRPGSGRATVYVKFRDKAGNESTVYHDSIDVRSARTVGTIVGKARVKGTATTAGIQVFVINQPDFAPVMTGADGSFTLDALPVGTYDLRFVRDADGQAIVRNIEVRAGATTTLRLIELDMQRVYLPSVQR